MKVTFFHDHRFKVDNGGNYYSLGGLSNESFKSYLNFFDEVTVIARKEPIQKDMSKKYTEVKLEQLKMNCFENLGKFELLGLNKFRKKIKNEVKKAEIIIARVPSFIGTLALEEANKLGKPVIVEVVANAWDGLWNYGNIEGKLLAPVMQIRNKRAIKKSSHVIYVTERYLQAIYPTKGKSTSISNVVLKDEDDLTRQRRKEKKVNDCIIIGTIGNLETVSKGQKYVIESLPLLDKKVKYQLVGSGNKDRLEQISRENNVIDDVEFVGSLSHENIFKWLETIDLYIQPSKQEGLPRALIEAMSKGVPCLGSSTAGIPELLDEDEIFSNKNNKQEISEKIKKILQENLEDISIKNIKKSQKYKKNKLDEKRNLFYGQFILDNFDNN